ncbi:hypothetical protein BDV93DRAFT_611572, partial [Ceratobasidium sp. AG-I]
MSALPPPPGAVFAPPPLPPGWTEHKAPAGHTYYYNAATKQSTYTRPLPVIHMGGPLPGPPPPFLPPGFLPGPNNIPPAPPIFADAAPAANPGTEKKSKKSKKEKPRTKTPIAGTEWIRVVTTLDNVFFTHTGRKESVWVCPEEIAEAVAELEREEEKLKAEEREREAREKVEKEQREREERERAEVERVKKEVEAAGAKRKAEEPGEGASKKPRVDDDDEFEEDEEWQREMAEEMANEEKRQAAAREKESTSKEGEVSIPPVFAVPDQVKLNPEEAKALFTTLLNEVSPNPMLPYDSALPQLVNDARYVLIPPNERKSIFDDWCKERARSLRKNKTKEATTTPESAYEGLLQAEVKSTRTTWDDFRRKWRKDRRYYGYGRDDKEREKKFRAWLVELGEVKRKEAKKAEDGFIELLKSVDGISASSNWKDVKRGIAQDPRYDAVGSATRREEMFNKFKSTFQRKSHSPPPATNTEPLHETKNEKESKSARRERALKEREAQVRGAQSKVEKDIGRSRRTLGKEEAEREFGTVLTDAIRDPLVSWNAALSMLESDPRFKRAAQILPGGAQRALFSNHINHIRSRYVSQLHALFEAHAPSLDMPAEELPKSVRRSLPAVKLGFAREDDEKHDKDDKDETEDGEQEPRRRRSIDPGLADEYARWQRTRAADARVAFDTLLGENPFVEFWGRLAKMGGEGVGGGVPIEEEEENEEGEGGGGKVDMKALAKNVDVGEMEKVLKHDKRYTIFDHIPEQREQWIRDYLSRQAAPKLSVHAPEAR